MTYIERIIIAMAALWVLFVFTGEAWRKYHPFRTDLVIEVGDYVPIWNGVYLDNCIVLRGPHLVNDGVALREYIRADCSGIRYDEPYLTEHVGVYSSQETAKAEDYTKHPGMPQR